MSHSWHTANRMRDIAPFHVMDLLARAKAREQAGESIVHMEVGEPDFVTPGPVIEAGKRALDKGYTHYTPALGLPQLREAIARFYTERYGVTVSPQRVVVTPGASGALQLLMGVLIDPGDEVMLSDPGYPCNRHFVRLFEGKPVAVPVTAESAYQLTPELLGNHAGKQTRAVLLASPSNPTGTLLSVDQLQQIYLWTNKHSALLIVDELYHGLVYGQEAETALGISDDIIVVNSFSKYFGMTGWRLGWTIVPEALVPELDRLAQNIFLAAPTMAQWAALEAFKPAVIEELDARRDRFMNRRDFLMPALQDLGFDIKQKPEGAFYLYADCSRHTDDSFAFSHDLLEKAGVAITPGLDFGAYRAEQHVRFAYTTSMEKLEEGVERIEAYLKTI